MDSFVLQTSDSDIQNGEFLGRLGFAANEADTGDARAISAVVSAMAEAPFTSTSNPTSIVFATAFDGDATNKLRITSSGNFLPFVSGIYDIGSGTLPFRKVFTDELRVGDYNFPTSDGSNGHVLSTDGAGQLSFVSVASATDKFIDSLDFDTSTNVLTIGRSDGTDFTETINAGGGTIDGGGTADYNAKWVDSDTLTSGIIYDDGSKIGIGTDNPTELLAVSGDAQINKIQIGSQAYSIGSHTQGITHADYDDNQSYMIISDGNNTYTSCHNLSGFNYMRGPQNGTAYQVVVGNNYMWIGTNSFERMTIGSTETVFNQDASGVDFRIEGISDTNLLRVDASEDMIGIGHAHPRTKLHVRSSTGEGTILSQTDDTTSWAGFLIRNDEDTNVGSLQFGNGGVLSPDYTHLRDVLFAGSRESGIPFEIYQGRDLKGDGTPDLPFRTNNQRIILNTSGDTILTAASGQQIFASGQSVMIPTESPSGSTILVGRHPYEPSIRALGGSETKNQWMIVDSSGTNAALNYFSNDNVLLAYGGGNVAVGTRGPGSGPGSYKFRVTGGPSVFDGGNVLINDDGGNYHLRVEGASDVNLFKTHAVNNSVSIGAAPELDYVKFFLYSYDKQYQQIIGGGCSGVGLLNNSYVTSGVTSATAFYSYMYPASNTNTLNSLIHFRAARPVTASTGPVTTERGFYADVSGATTNNWGFQGIVPTGDNNYNLYMSSDAKNYLAGNLGIGDEGAAYNGAHRVPLSISPIDYAVTGSPNAAQQTNKIRVYDREGSGIAGLGVSTSSFNIATSGLIDQRFWTNSNERMRITHDGKVGIKTSSPAFTLDVNGDFSADEINVNGAFTFPTVDGSAGQVLKTDGFGNVSWGIAGSTDNVVQSASFDTGNGVLSLGRTGGLTDVTVDLDGRFSLTDTTYADGTGLSLLGTTFHANVDATVQTVSHTPVTSTASRTYAVQVDESNDLVVNVPWVDTDTNHYVNSASFNTADGVLTLSRLGLNNVTVDLDGRYQQTLTNPVTGTGAANYVARWSSSNVLSTGIIYDDGTNAGISNTSPNCRLTLGSNITGVSNDGISIDMGGVNKPSFTTRRNTGNPVFSILPYTSQIYLSAGVYYNGSAWIHSSNDVHNCIFTLDPGAGVLWYAGNNGSSISNIASAEVLWDTNGHWKSCVEVDDAACHNYMMGSLSVGDNHQVNSSKLHLKQDYSTAGGTTSVNAQYVDIDTTSTQDLTNYTIAVHVDARKDVSTGKTDSGYIMGADFNAALDGTSTGTLVGSYGIRTFAGIRDAGTVNNAYGVYSRVLNLGTGTINNGYGIYIHNVNATNSYGLYQSATDDKNYFAGSVGIGFVNPSYKLDVAGSIRSLLASNNKCVFSTNNIVAKIQPYDVTSTTYIGNESNHDLVFRTSNLDRLSIEAAGNVGIGTNNPLYLLDVNGDFSANSVNINDQFTFPTSDGSADQMLVTNGAGVLTWEDQPSVVSSSNLTRGSFVVTSTTSLFTVSGGYGTNTLDVYQNGVKLFKGQSPGSYDYQETGGGTSFTLTNAATSGDLIEYVALNASTNAVGNTSLGSVSVTSNQTVFNTTDTFTSSNLAVFLNGVKLVDGTDYNVTSSSQFTLTSTAVSGDIVEYIAYGATVASSNLSKTGDTMTGNLTVNADLIVTGYKETHTDNGNTGTVQTIDISDSTVQTYTLNGNCTFNMPAIEAGRSFTMFLKTGAGSFTATFTNVKFPENSSPTITTDANRMDLITFTCDGTSWYGNAIQDYYI